MNLMMVWSGRNWLSSMSRKSKMIIIMEMEIIIMIIPTMVIVTVMIKVMVTAMIKTMDIVKLLMLVLLALYTPM